MGSYSLAWIPLALVLLTGCGRHVIGVGVRDDIGGSMSTKKLDIKISKSS